MTTRTADVQARPLIEQNLRSAPHRQRLRPGGRDGERVGQYLGQRHDYSRLFPHGHPGDGQEPVPLEHFRPADLVHHPPEQGWLYRPPRDDRDPGRLQPGNRRRRPGEPAQRRRLLPPERLEVPRAARRCGLLSLAGQRTGQGIGGRPQAARLRRHDGLCRRAGRDSGHRSGRDQGRPDASNSRAKRRPWT